MKRMFEGFFSPITTALTYKILVFLGVPDCANIDPISEACRIAAVSRIPESRCAILILAGTQVQEVQQLLHPDRCQYHPTDDVMSMGRLVKKGYKDRGLDHAACRTRCDRKPDSKRKGNQLRARASNRTLIGTATAGFNAACFRRITRASSLNFQAGSPPPPPGYPPTIRMRVTPRSRGFELK